MGFETISFHGGGAETNPRRRRVVAVDVAVVVHVPRLRRTRRRAQPPVARGAYRPPLFALSFAVTFRPCVYFPVDAHAQLLPALVLLVADIAPLSQDACLMF